MAGQPPETVLTNYDLRDAVATLRRAGFGTYVFEKGTIGAYKGKRCYGFPPRFGRFSKEAITRAIEGNA